MRLWGSLLVRASFIGHRVRDCMRRCVRRAAAFTDFYRFVLFLFTRGTLFEVLIVFSKRKTLFESVSKSA